MKTIFALTVACALVASTIAQAAEKKAKVACWSGYITCEQWCDRYRGGSGMCKFTHAQSCTNKYGSLKACVKNGPPVN